MKKRLCCLLRPEMKCGFCPELWCRPCFDKLNKNDNWTICPVPNNSGSDQGNHFTGDYGGLDIDDEWLSNIRPLKKKEKVTDFDGDNSII